MNDIKFKIEYFRETWREKLFSEAAARLSGRFPGAAYWITLSVGARNIETDEVVPTVSFMDVLNRQFMKTKAFGHDV